MSLPNSKCRYEQRIPWHEPSRNINCARGKRNAQKILVSYDRGWSCMMGNCRSIEPNFESSEAWLNRLRGVHGESKWNLFSMKRLIEEAEQEKWSNHLAAPFTDHEPGPSQNGVRVR